MHYVRDPQQLRRADFGSHVPAPGQRRAFAFTGHWFRATDPSESAVASEFSQVAQDKPLQIVFAGAK